MSKLKVLFLTNKLLIGGAETILINQVNLINQNKFKPFVGLLYKTDKVNNLYGKLKISNDQIKHFDFKQNLGILDICGVMRLMKFLRQNKIDIIFTSLFESNFVGRLAAKLVGTKVIISSEHSCYYGKKFWQKQADWILSFFTDTIVAVTEEVLLFTSEQENIDKSKFQVIKQISDLSIAGMFDRVELKKKFEIPDRALVCGTLGRFSPEKAQYRVIDIADQIINKMNLKNIYFIIIGYGKLYDDLKEKIKRHNLEKYVIIIVDPSNAKEYLVMVDIFLLTSDREGMPIVLLEAMNNGLPCISSNAGGVVDVVSDGVNGFLISENHLNQFVEKIVWFTDHLSSIKSMGLNAQNQVKKKVGDIKELENLFISLVNQK